MTQQHHTSDVSPQPSHAGLGSPLAQGERPTIGRLLRDQRKIMWVALALVVVDFWITGPMDHWLLGTCIALGVALALVNHVATEWWLLRQISSPVPQTRNEMIRANFVRFAVLAVVAVAIAALMWPDGIGVLLALAVFRFIALFMTSVTTLKELKQQ